MTDWAAPDRPVPEQPGPGPSPHPPQPPRRPGHPWASPTPPPEPYRYAAPPAYWPPRPPYPAPYPQPWPGSGPPPAPRSTSGHAIASLVFGLCGGVLLGIAFGVIGLGRTRPGGQRGRGLAVAGLVLSGLWLAVFAVAAVVTVAEDTSVEAGGAVAEAGEAVTEAGDVGWETIRVGDCLNRLVESSSKDSVPAVPCSRPHEAEVFAVLRLPDGTWPGEAALERAVDARCSAALAAYAPSHAGDASVDFFNLFPTEETWKQLEDRDVTCIATSTTGTTTGSLQD